MSGHHEQNKEGSGPNSITLAMSIAVGTVALIIGIILLANFAVGMYGARSLKDDSAMSPEAVARRLAPVAKTEVDPNAPAAAVAAPVAVVAVAVPAPAGKAEAGGGGKATYDTACAVCHGAGIAGAPKLGDKAAWTPRLKAGIEALHAAALKGKGAMPPKGGNASLSDDVVKAAVDYMAGAAK